MNAFEALAISSSVPFSRNATGEEMHRVFSRGEIPVGLEPHIERVLSELPVELLARCITECADDVDQLALKNNFSTLAELFGAEPRLRTWLTG